MSYNDIINNITKQEDEDIAWKLKCIIAHEGPPIAYNTNYKGYWYNVMVEWETGEKTTYLISNIAADDTITCYLYAYENNFLKE